MIRSAIIGRTNPLNNTNSNINTVPTRDTIDRLLEMGFTEENAKAALTRTRNDLSSAIELIMDDQLINPEARNDDFRMNANNSNILTNISNRNLPNGITNTENNNNVNTNNEIMRIENNNENINNNRINNYRANIPTISRATETNITNNSNNLRRVNFEYDLENENLDNTSLLDIFEPFEIDLPYNNNNVRENYLPFTNRNRHSSFNPFERFHNRINTINRNLDSERTLNNNESLITTNINNGNLNSNRINISNGNSNNPIRNSINNNINENYNIRTNTYIPRNQTSIEGNNLDEINMNNEIFDITSEIISNFRYNVNNSNDYSNSDLINRNSDNSSNIQISILLTFLL